MSGFSPRRISQSLLKPVRHVASQWHWAPKQWMLVLVATVGISGAVGGSALLYMLNAPDFSECSTGYNSGDPASAKLYCADKVAAKQTIKGLQDAMRLVRSISPEDPLRPQGDRRVESWSLDLLRLGENAFQSGNLDDALAAVKAIPPNTPIYEQAQKQEKGWQETWDKAEEIYKKAKSEIGEKRWSGAINVARGLLKLGNEHWATVKYKELMDGLQAARTNSEDKTDNTPNPAKKTPKAKGDAIAKLDPLADWNSRQEAEAESRLGKARTLAQSGQLKDAIDEAERVLFGTPQREQADQLIRSWEDELQVNTDHPRMARAVALASKGDESSLQAAIDEAERIAPGHQLYKEARSRIQQWSNQVYKLQVETQTRELERTSSPRVIPVSQDPILDRTPMEVTQPDVYPSPIVEFTPQPAPPSR